MNHPDRVTTELVGGNRVRGTKRAFFDVHFTAHEDLIKHHAS